MFYGENGSKKELIFQEYGTILKIGKNGHQAKLDPLENRHFKVVVCKKRLEKTANIPKMRAF